MDEGCTKLFLIDRDIDGLENTRTEIRAQDSEVEVEICQVDISKEEDVNRMIESCVAKFRRIDYALNVAGVVPMRTPHADVDIVDYDKTISINEYGVSG